MCNDDDKELFFLFIAKHSFRGGGVIEVFEYIKKSMEINRTSNNWNNVEFYKL